MPSFSHLSQEILDSIVDFCAESRDDTVAKKEMKSCSLVCRALRRRAQSKIFAEIEIRENIHSSELSKLVTANTQLAKYIKTLCVYIGSLTSEEYFLDSETSALLASLTDWSPSSSIALSLRHRYPEKDSTAQIRQISSHPAAFSRVTSLTLFFIKHIPLQLFGALPQLSYLELTAVTFYPGFETLSDAELENLITACFKSLKTLIFNQMSCVPGIMIASCPVLDVLQLLGVWDLDNLEYTPNRILPAPKSVSFAFSNYNGLIATLVDSVIDVRQLAHVEDCSREVLGRAEHNIVNAEATREELSCILSRCESPTSNLGSLSLDFYAYVYPTLTNEVAIDLSRLPTLTHLTMAFYCLQPEDDVNVPLHIRDILRTRQKSSKLANIDITLTIAFSERHIREDGTCVLDPQDLPAVFNSHTMKEGWEIFAHDAVGLQAKGIVSIEPVRLDPNSIDGFTPLNVKFDDNLFEGLEEVCETVFPDMKSEVLFVARMPSGNGPRYEVSCRGTDEGIELEWRGNI